MSTLTPLGLHQLALARYGDGQETSIYPRKQAMGLSYTVTPSMYSAPMGLSYTVQNRNTAPLLLYYTVTPTPTFSLNGVAISPRPDQMSYTLRPVIAHGLIGNQTQQGYTTVTWFYTTLLWNEYTTLLSFYSTSGTPLLIVYPTEEGVWVQRHAVMHPPSYGALTTLIVSSVSFAFNILPT